MDYFILLLCCVLSCRRLFGKSGIFNRENLAEYKRAFEAVSVNSDSFFFFLPSFLRPLSSPVSGDRSAEIISAIACRPRPMNYSNIRCKFRMEARFILFCRSFPIHSLLTCHVRLSNVQPVRKHTQRRPLNKLKGMGMTNTVLLESPNLISLSLIHRSSAGERGEANCSLITCTIKLW